MGQCVDKPSYEETINPNAECLIKIQYCGQWGYKGFCIEIKNHIERLQPGKFKYKFKQDSGVTGNLEVFVCDAKHQNENFMLVHSKTRGDGYPNSDWEKFNKEVD